MDNKFKYQFDNMQRGDVQWGFHDWLKKRVGEEAAEVYKSIICSEAIISIMDGYPRDSLTLQQKKMITYAKKRMAKAADWLNEQEHKPHDYTRHHSPP